MPCLLRRNLFITPVALGLSAAAWWACCVKASGPDPIEPLVPRTAAFASAAPTHAPTTAATQTAASNPSDYAWPRTTSTYESLAARFPPPTGYARQPAEPGSFQAWLRGLPTRPPGTPVRSFDGRKLLAANDRRLAGVVDWDLGATDLQQCADSAIRLNAEWACAQHPHAAIAFDFTCGATSSWTKWREGYRPIVAGNFVRFAKTTGADESRAAFRAWQLNLFRYAGTVSLNRQSTPAKLGDGRPGFLIHPGSPGHVIVVLDCARLIPATAPTPSTQSRQSTQSTPSTAPTAAAPEQYALLLGQGYMPAQDFQILRAPDGTPWHLVSADAPTLTTHFGTYTLATDYRHYPTIPNLPE